MNSQKKRFLPLLLIALVLLIFCLVRGGSSGSGSIDTRDQEQIVVSETEKIGTDLISSIEGEEIQTEQIAESSDQIIDEETNNSSDISGANEDDLTDNSGEVLTEADGNTSQNTDESDGEVAESQGGQPGADLASDTNADLSNSVIAEEGSYTTKDEVALYLYTYGKLPSNYITKKEAEDLGWSGGAVEKYAPGMSIGGGKFGNYEEILPTKKGRKYYECDIDTVGKSSRGAKRIVFSNDGLIYYTEDHYETFELLYGTP